jgi:hypothetical protein
LVEEPKMADESQATASTAAAEAAPPSEDVNLPPPSNTPSSSSSSSSSSMDAAPPSTSPTTDENGQEHQSAELMIKMYKERNVRLETLIAQQRQRINEYEESDAKMKRLLNLAKRSIENKDASIEALKQQVLELKMAEKKQHSDSDHNGRREPRRILQRVRQRMPMGGPELMWCLVEYVSDNDHLDDMDGSNAAKLYHSTSESCGWHAFRNEDELLEYICRISGEPCHVPDVSLPPTEIQQMVYIYIYIYIYIRYHLLIVLVHVQEHDNYDHDKDDHVFTIETRAQSCLGTCSGRISTLPSSIRNHKKAKGRRAAKTQCFPRGPATRFFRGKWIHGYDSE